MIQFPDMRKSGLKHTVAILRNVIGLGQKELAALVNVSPATIQSIELNSGRLSLSQSLGEKISYHTGVDLKWLMDNNTRKPITSRYGQPYTRESYEEHQANLDQRYRDGDLAGLQFSLDTLFATILSIYVEAAKIRKGPLANYKLHRAVEAIKKELRIEDTKQKIAMTWAERCVRGHKLDVTKFGLQWLTDVFWPEMMKALKTKKPSSVSA